MAPIYDVVKAEITVGRKEIGEKVISARRVPDGKYQVHHGEAGIIVRIQGDVVIVDVPSAYGMVDNIDIHGLGEESKVSEMIEHGVKEVKIEPHEGQSAITIFGGAVQLGHKNLERHKKLPTVVKL